MFKYAVLLIIALFNYAHAQETELWARDKNGTTVEAVLRSFKILDGRYSNPVILRDVNGMIMSRPVASINKSECGQHGKSIILQYSEMKQRELMFIPGGNNAPDKVAKRLCEIGGDLDYIRDKLNLK